MPAVDGTAIVICDGSYGTVNGKTAHGLVRGTDRYRILAVVDPPTAGRDAGEVLDGISRGIPIYTSIDEGSSGFRRSPTTRSSGSLLRGGG